MSKDTRHRDKNEKLPKPNKVRNVHHSPTYVLSNTYQSPSTSTNPTTTTTTNMPTNQPQTTNSLNPDPSSSSSSSSSSSQPATTQTAEITLEVNSSDELNDRRIGRQDMTVKSTIGNNEPPTGEQGRFKELGTVDSDPPTLGNTELGRSAPTKAVRNVGLKHSSSLGISEKPPRATLNEPPVAPSPVEPITNAPTSPPPSPTPSPPAPQPTSPVNTFVCPPALKERGYEITEEIGGGAFSKVYRARYRQLADKEIAVKIISLDKVPEVWREKCLRQELRIVRKLQHPHIVKVWDIIKTRRNVFIFMDLAENNSVLHYMQNQNKHLPENVARIWFTQTTGAISYMHSKGIAHRDLKNENILLDRDHNAKLTDFGFACHAIDKDTKLPVLSPTCCGTIAYIAPEVLNPPYEARVADIWSLGVCLFEMVTFTKPFDDTNNHRKLLKMQLNRSWHFPSSIEEKLSDQVKDLVNRMLDPDVDQRLSAMQILQHPWIVSGFGTRS